jgi:hypothetical protein
MNLLGWDTTSALDIDLVNQALEAEQEGLVNRFLHIRDNIVLRGLFGPWQIVRGGSMRLLHMDLHIRSGQARGIRTKGTRPVELGGMILHVEIPLRMVPSPDGKTPAQLRFIIREDDPEEVGKITALGLTDPHGQLDEMELELLQLALTDCLSAHLDKVAFVFAAVTPHKAGSWAATPHIDWAALETGDGRAYLAILGALGQPTPEMEPDKIDPDLIVGEGTAYHAFSPRLYASQMLVPWLNANFKPKASFKAAGATAKLAAPVSLSKIDTPVGKKTPVLRRLEFSMKKGGMGIFVKSTVDVGGGVTIHVEVTMFLPMILNAKTGIVGLRPDPKPKTKHWTEGHGPFGGFVKLFVDLILDITGTNVAAIAKGVATKMQSINTPAAQPVVWTGTRGFVATKAECDGVIFLADTRPA